tara:strand:- start:65 stop:172 length:108 start_codon:yes stop_codon:yes gene_type:complete
MKDLKELWFFGCIIVFALSMISLVFKVVIFIAKVL